MRFSRVVSVETFHGSISFYGWAIRLGILFGALASMSFASASLAQTTSYTGTFPLTISDVSPHPSNEFNAQQGPAGRIISFALASDGLRMYAGSKGGGLWRSDNGGAQWHQIVSAQPGDQVVPGCGATNAPQRIGTLVIESVAVSPQDPNLVFVGTGNDRETCSGVYRSGDGGVTWQRVFSQQSSSCPGATSTYSTGYGPQFNAQYEPINEVAFAPDDSSKLWAVAGCVVAYSTARSELPWSGLSRPTPSSAIGWNWTTSTLTMPQVTHIAVGGYNAAYRNGAGGRAIWACSSSSQLWSSVDGGMSYVPVPVPNPINRWCSGESPVHESHSPGEHELVADDSHSSPIVYLLSPYIRNQHAIPIATPLVVVPCPSPSCQGITIFGITQLTRTDSASGPNFETVPMSGPPVLPDTHGSGEISLSGFWSGSQLYLIYSDDEDFFIAAAAPYAEKAWHRLNGIDADLGCSRGVCDPTKQWWPGGNGATALHDDAHAFAIVPGTQLQIGQNTLWTLSSPLASCRPIRSGAATMVQGNDGGLAISHNCGQDWQYGDISTVAAANLAGLSHPGQFPALYFGSHDDGSWFSMDGGHGWQAGVSGCGDCIGYFSTARDSYTVATIFRVNLHPDDAPGPFQDCCRWMIWHSFDGTYPAPNTTATGDFEFTPYQQHPRMVSDRGYAPLIEPVPSDHLPGLPSIALVSATPHFPPGTGPTGEPNAYSNYVLHKIDLRLTGGTIQQTDMAIHLPSSLPHPLVQTSGGVTQTTFYALGRSVAAYPPNPDGSFPWDANVNAETDAVFRADPPIAGSGYNWTQIIPSGIGCAWTTGYRPTMTSPYSGACHAYKLAVDPFHPRMAGGEQLLYATDDAGVIRESLNGGRSWFENNSLTNWLTDQNQLANAPHWQWFIGWGDSDEELHTMLFDLNEDGTAFAAGIEGVFMTLDAGCAQTGSGGDNCASRHGEQWHRIFDSTATPCQPNGLFFDANEPDGRALYLSCSQRGVLKILGIPRPSDQRQLDLTGPSLSHPLAGKKMGYPPQPTWVPPNPGSQFPPRSGGIQKSPSQIPTQERPLYEKTPQARPQYQPLPQYPGSQQPPPPKTQRKPKTLNKPNGE